MAEQYYVRIRGRVGGPFDEQKLKLLVQRGQLSRSHEVSEDGANWFPAGEFEELFAKRVARQAAPVAEPDAKTVGTAGAAPANASAVAEPPGAAWFVAIDGERKGPFSWNALRSQANAGLLPGDALVWTEGMDDWMLVSSVPKLTGSDGSDDTSGKPQIPWSELFPLFRSINDGSWQLPWVLCLAVALLFPLLVMEYHGQDTVRLAGVALAFSLYFSLLWTAFFYWCIQPSRLSAWRPIGAWFLTGTLGILGVVVVEALAIPVFSDVLIADNQASLLKRVVGWTIAVGLIEECAKMCAVLAFTAGIRLEHAPRTCAYVGVVSGLAFGTIEAVFYTYLYTASHSMMEESLDEAYGVLFLSLMTRWVSLPLLHAVWAGISGFFVGLSQNPSNYRWRWVFIGLVTSSLLHGLYDVGAADSRYSWLTIVSAAVSLALLVGYLRSEETLYRRVSKFQPRTV